MVGASLFVVGATVTFVNALLVGPVIERWGEVRAVVIGFSGMALGFLIFAFASEGWMAFVGIFPFALIGVSQPAIRGMMANRVPADTQGELQGAAASLMSFTMIFSPLIMTELFHEFTRDDAFLYFPGAPFLAAALLALVALGLFLPASHAPETAVEVPDPSGLNP
jgi:DHA1 family tetracycline resistance protein-like MFS transporter